MIWTRTDRPARVQVEISTTESFDNARQLAPMNALPNHDLAVKRLVEGLPSDQDIFYRFTAADLSDINATSEPIIGQFRTAPTARRDVRFAWSGDTAGQGWGIDDEGMRTYATMAKHRPTSSCIPVTPSMPMARLRMRCSLTTARCGRTPPSSTRNARWLRRWTNTAVSGNTT
nr:PhoD-like phosphatase N-terminal domain-containing protein [Sulfitobacter faviae]